MRRILKYIILTIQNESFIEALFFIGITSTLCGLAGTGLGVIALFVFNLTGGWLWAYFPMLTGFIGLLVGPYLYWENEIYDWIMK